MNWGNFYTLLHNHIRITVSLTKKCTFIGWGFCDILSNTLRHTICTIYYCKYQENHCALNFGFLGGWPMGHLQRLFSSPFFDRTTPSQISGVNIAVLNCFAVLSRSPDTYRKAKIVFFLQNICKFKLTFVSPFRQVSNLPCLRNHRRYYTFENET